MERFFYIFLVTIMVSSLSSCSRKVDNYLKALKSDNIVVQLDTIKILIKKKEKDKRLVSALIPLLSSELKNVRQKSIEALGCMGAKEAVPDIIKALNDPDPDVVKEAISALGKIGDKRAVPSLLSLLEKNNEELSAIWALGNIGDRRAVPLLSRLSESENKFIKYNAIQSLKKIR